MERVKNLIHQSDEQLIKSCLLLEGGFLDATCRGG